MEQKPLTIQCSIKSYRLIKGWSQEDLAQKIEVGRQAIYDMESGRYLPNTAVALRLARVFECRVEDLFVESTPDGIGTTQPVTLLEKVTNNSRLMLGRVRGKLVGMPLQGAEAMSFSLRPADGFLVAGGKKTQIFSSSERVDQALFIMGCDPALEILGSHIKRELPASVTHCLFASSKKSLSGLAKGNVHVAATHFHNAGKTEANVVAVRKLLGDIACHILGFSLVEEGLMVTKNNPFSIRCVADLAQPGIRFVNREHGAALRALLDTHLAKAKVPSTAVQGYTVLVGSHAEGAWHVACKTADAALGLRVVAENFGLHFIPIATTRCDLVIPVDLANSPSIVALLDTVQSSRLRKELASIPGYDSTFTGKIITAP